MATAATVTAATRASAGLRTGRLSTSAGRDFGTAVTRANAAATSTRGSGTASRVATDRASSAMSLKRAWHSAQGSRCDASAPVFASASSNIRRSVPSVRWATVYLLAQRFLGAPQQSSNLGDADAQRLGDLGVAEPARAQHQHRGGLGSQPRETGAQAAPVLFDLSLTLRIDRPVALLERLRDLPLLPAARAAQAIERGVRRGSMEPGRGVFGVRGVQAVEVDEDLLGDVLRLVRIGQDAVGDPDDAAIFGCEKGLEGLGLRAGRGHAAGIETHAHYS